jgi:L-ribulokinase (EC 2.7.1.16)
MSRWALGLDYGTNSVRALVVDVQSGEEVGGAVWKYRHGEHGILMDPRRPELARQHPRDYLDGLRAVVRNACGRRRSAKVFPPKT